jgi:3-oxoacyl-[acyl-carrier-protein] synthase II
MSDPVVVTGIGVVGPGGVGPEALWGVLTATDAPFAPVAYDGGAPGALAATAPAIARGDVVRTPVGRRIDRLSLMMLTASRDALSRAGLSDDDLAGERTGVVLGSAFGNFEETAGFLDRLRARGRANPMLFPNLVMNAALSYVSIELGVTGPTLMVTQQEISGEAAIAAGADLVASGTVDRCLAGAGDELTAETYQVLREVGVLAKGPPRVYDERADGFVPGEGAAVLVLERLSTARARSARVWARIAAWDEFGVDASVHDWPRDPEPLAARLVPLARGADVVFGAASGAAAVDRLEAAVLARLGSEMPPLCTPRARLGHFGSVGALAAAGAALAIAHAVVPPGPPACSHPIERALNLEARARSLERIATAVVVGIARGGACCVLRLEDAST